MKKSKLYVSHDETLKEWLEKSPENVKAFEEAKKDLSNDPEWLAFLASQPSAKKAKRKTEANKQIQAAK